MPDFRTPDQVDSTASSFLKSNATDVLVQEGSVPQDIIDAFSQEMGNWYALMEFNDLKTSVTGLLNLVSGTPEYTAFISQLQAALEYTDSEMTARINLEVDNKAADYDLTRNLATSPTTVLRFFSTSSANATIPINTTARTQGDNSIEYKTTMDVSNQPVTLDPASGLYYIDIAAQASIAGIASRVSVNRITALLPPITGFTSVTNIVASSGGTDDESNTDLLNWCLLAERGRELDTINGLKLFALEQTGVEDALAVDASSPLMLRGHGNEVDIYIMGGTDQVQTDTAIYDSVLMGGSIILNKQPANSVSSVSVNGTPLTAGTDYNFVVDEAGFMGSNIAVSNVTFVPGHGPSNGDSVVIQYIYNALVSVVQSQFLVDANWIPNSDILIKEATALMVDIEMTVVNLPSYSLLDVQNRVLTAVQAYFNTLKLGMEADISEVVATVQGVIGVSKVDVPFQKMALVGQTGFSDIVPTQNEYVALNSLTYV